jgi:hypothetical protein
MQSADRETAQNRLEDKHFCPVLIEISIRSRATIYAKKSKISPLRCPIPLQPFSSFCVYWSERMLQGSKSEKTIFFAPAS